jgi:ABC-type thiamine transport system substrate-binding protein
MLLKTKLILGGSVVTTSLIGYVVFRVIHEKNKRDELKLQLQELNDKKWQRTIVMMKAASAICGIAFIMWKAKQLHYMYIAAPSR